MAEFRRSVSDIKNDPELLSVVKNEYGSRLLQIVENGGERAPIARQFLSVLGIEEKQTPVGLSSDARKEIKDTFKDFDGSLSKRQREILDKYQVGYEQSRAGSHWHLTYGEGMVTASHSSSDWRTGRNVASDIIHMLEKKGKKKN